MEHDLFRGVFPYLVSPIDERGQAKEAVLRRRMGRRNDIAA